MSPYVSSHNAKRRFMYLLTGIVSHHGESMDSGHYTAATRGIDDGCWFAFNDDSPPQLITFPVNLQRDIHSLLHEDLGIRSSTSIEWCRWQRRRDPW